MQPLLSRAGALALPFALALSMIPSSARAQATTPAPAPVPPSAQPERKPPAVQPTPGSAPVAEPPAPVAATPGAPAEAAVHEHPAVPEDDAKIPGDDPRWKKVSLRITSPKEGQVVPAGHVSVSFALKRYQTPGAAPAPPARRVRRPPRAASGELPATHGGTEDFLSNPNPRLERLMVCGSRRTAAEFYDGSGAGYAYSAYFPDRRFSRAQLWYVGSK
jgi:hypothetical protein